MTKAFNSPGYDLFFIIFWQNGFKHCKTYLNLYLLENQMTTKD